MTVLLTTGASGTEDAAVTTGSSGGVNGSAVDAVSTGGSGTLTHDDQHGFPKSYKVVGDASANILMTYSTSMGTIAEGWGIAYLYLTGAPAANDAFVWLRNGSSQVARIRATPAGKLDVTNAANGVVDTSAASIALNQWVAVTWQCQAAVSGLIEATLWNDLTPGASPTEVVGGAATLISNITQVGYGRVGNSSPNTKWMANLGYSNEGAMSLIPPTSKLIQVELQGSALSQARTRLLEVELQGTSTSQARSRLLEVLLSGHRSPEDLEPADTWAASGGVWRPMYTYPASGGQWS
jgi:hypothetical protein